MNHDAKDSTLPGSEDEPWWEREIRALRPRYRLRPGEVLRQRTEGAIRGGMSVLDVGAGRSPFLSPPRPDIHYAGLDIDRSLLEEAGTYDEMIEADICHFVPELEGRFDVIVCWQVLEHVKPIEAAFENMRRYLKPGGTMFAQFSGTWSVFGIANRLIPERLAVKALARLLHREERTVFPAHYHHCWQSALERAMTPWSTVEITPFFTGAVYFGFSFKLRSLYLRYEDWTTRYPSLASYYHVVATR
jgi:SAM-dependent methyltransferase